MGHSDHWDIDCLDLPPEAGIATEQGFEPDNAWIKEADYDEKIAVMLHWFSSRYQDPACDTPWVGSEGGYIFIHGGPYDARDSLHDRFGGRIQDELIEDAAQKIEECGITEWAPIHSEPDYEDIFEIEIPNRDLPLEQFQQRQQDLCNLLAYPTESHLQELQFELVFSSIIAALEAYLSETMSYWLKHDTTVFRRYVENCRKFQSEQFKLSEIFLKQEEISNIVDEQLQSTVWHRLDKVSPLIASSLNIKEPEIKTLMPFITKRHHFVHRSGRTKTGERVTVTSQEFAMLLDAIHEFIQHIEDEISFEYPYPF